MCLTRKTETVWRSNRVLILAVALLAIGQALLEAAPRPQQPKPPAVQPAQPRPAQPVQPRPAQPAPAGQRREKIPPPEEISGSQLQTRDGVQLSATFFPAPKEKGKESVPVLLLHNWKSSRKEFAVLAPELQKIGCAVLVPDLRGHGASTKKMDYTKKGLQEMELDAAKFKKLDFLNIRVNDMAALRGFLVKKNNAGELNLNKLVVVGSEMGATIAVLWAAYDWSIPNYEHAGIKQSQDVKALVLISPELDYKGLDMSKIVNAPGAVRDRLSVMLLVGGEDTGRLKDAQTIESRLVTNRSQPEALPERKVLLVPPLPTKMQAEQLLNFRDFPIPKMICHFIETQVIKDEPDAVWMEHK